MFLTEFMKNRNQKQPRATASPINFTDLSQVPTNFGIQWSSSFQILTRWQEFTIREAMDPGAFRRGYLETAASSTRADLIPGLQAARRRQAGVGDDHPDQHGRHGPPDQGARTDPARRVPSEGEQLPEDT